MSGADGTADELKELFPARSRRQVFYNLPYLSGRSFMLAVKNGIMLFERTCFIIHEKL